MPILLLLLLLLCCVSGAFHEALPRLLQIETLHNGNITGRGVRVGIFDTGLAQRHPDLSANVKERINWTNEGHTAEDPVGHGSFVASVVAGKNSKCPGVAPDAELYIMRVFTSKRASYTSWFLDAFNHILTHNIHIINLSIGGPDFADQPFTEKIQELVANGVIVVSAVGNEGPSYGTLNNPADQLEVIGVGAVDESGDRVAPFSARGMTLWELPRGYGRVKPDLVTVGTHIVGSQPFAGLGCRSMSGTSAASPVVAGALALLASSIPEPHRWQLLNPAAAKQLLLESADPLPSENHIYEQGAGRMNATRAYELLHSGNFSHHLSALPSSLDLTHCPYMWPHCDQPLYTSTIPLVTINITVINSLSLWDEFTRVEYDPSSLGEMLEVRIEASEVLWPWVGWISLEIKAAFPQADGIAEGHVLIETKNGGSLRLSLRARVIPTPPPRERRLLWDQYHSLTYPVGYIPRESFSSGISNSFDMLGDHLHTNFHSLYRQLRGEGYFVEVLREPWTSFPAEDYAALLLVDPEAPIQSVEIQHLEDAIRNKGLSLMVVGEWHHREQMERLRFYDENSRQWWFPDVSGYNAYDVNTLLRRFRMELGSHHVLDGPLDDTNCYYSSGTSITDSPSGGYLLHAKGLSDQMVEGRREDAAVLGWTQVASRNGGRIVLLGDSTCLEKASQMCFDSLFKHLFLYLSNGTDPPFQMTAELLQSAYEE